MKFSQPRWSRGNVLVSRPKVRGLIPAEVDGFFLGCKSPEAQVVWEELQVVGTESEISRPIEDHEA